MKNALLILCLITLPVFAQSTNITSIPPGTTVFKLTFQPDKGPEGQDTLYGAIKSGDDFLEDEYPADDSKLPPIIIVLSDSPSKPGEIKVAKRHLEVVQPETSQLRMKRYEDEGFVVATSNKGDEILVRKEAAERAKYLAEIQAQQVQEAQDRIAPFEELPAAVETDEGKPGFLSNWGRHALIVILSGLALFAIVKFSFQ